MASTRRSTYAPFDNPSDAAKQPVDEGSAAASLVGLVVLLSIMFVVLAVGHAVVDSIERRAFPPMDDESVDGAQALSIDSTDSAIRPSSTPAAPATDWQARLRPRPVLTDESFSVEDGLFRDTVTFTGTVHNEGGGGKIVLRATATRPSTGEGTKESVVASEPVEMFLNAGSTETYQVTLRVDDAVTNPPSFSVKATVP